MATDITNTVPSSRPLQAASQPRPEKAPETGGQKPAPQQNPVSSQSPAQSQLIQDSREKSVERQAALQEQQEKLQDAVSNINDYVQNIQRSLQFSIAEESGRTIITVVDSSTQEVIRQIPPEEVLSISERLVDGGGIILKEKA